ncbi:Krueppel c2h2-type zinc finger protein [Penicillium macrosclerotiorum]|uniref:Krueppel c2h2-type zinc finger protein n=1 Tax=Penicillium macrosclerotiorum TaxID=303699 RepID=UPI0025467696|nr:Krueppel c2h2-type zinc finger protein [Penicillium macrosclerotiorum]KAJ5679945.1 Krueppel c2h2-type zinc finger protein [Penicillium macrosclerotiorum]
MWYRNSGGVVRPANAQEISPVSRTETRSSDLESTPSASTTEEVIDVIDKSVQSAGHLSLSRGAAPDANTSMGNGPAMDSFHNAIDAAQEENVTSLFLDPSFSAPDPLLDFDWLFENVPASFGATDEDGLTDMISPSRTSTSDMSPPYFPMNSQAIRFPLPPDPSSFAPWALVQGRLFEALRTLPQAVLALPFFIPSNLSHFFELYFENYHPHFPILHRPTLDPTTAPALLIAAIVTLGSTLSNDVTHFETSIQIHDSLRYIIFNLMKRGVSYAIAYEGDLSLEQSWRQWIEVQSSNRTAFFGFVMDAQHSFMFGHTCVLSVQDVRLPLPCSDYLWECGNCHDWNSMYQKMPEPPGFLPVLKRLIARAPIPPNCTAYGRLILLHGLFSVTAHLKARDSVTLGVGGSLPHGSRLAATDGWKDTLEKAMDTWSFCLVSRSSSLALEASKPLHRMAYVAIYTEITDMHVLAGAPSLLGNMLSEADFAGATTRVRAWSERQEAKRALYHCLLLVQEILFTGKHYRAAQDNLSLRPWSLYHAALILWAFGFMSKAKAPAPKQDISLSAEEYLVRMLMLLRSDDDVGPVSQQTSELLKAVQESLEDCRWELLREAHDTLGRLVASST